MVAPKGRFQSREGYVRNVAKNETRRVVQEESELFEPVNRTAPQRAEEVAAQGRKAQPVPATPDRVVPAEPPRAGWLLRLWRRLLRLVTPRN